MTYEPIHKSLHRPQFFLGVDRELCMYSILIAVIVAAGGYNLISLFSGIFFWLLSIRYLRLWAKKDPQMRDVFLNYIRFVRLNLLYPSKTSAFYQNFLIDWKKKNV
jgi:type IV secretory pathway TrbD component